MKKEKHDHKLTNILKFCCFALLMAMPLLQTCGKLLYVALNPNANNEYTEKTKITANLNETIEVPSYYTWQEKNIATTLPTGAITPVQIQNSQNVNVYSINIWTGANGLSKIDYITQWLDSADSLHYSYDTQYEQQIQQVLDYNNLTFIYIYENEGTNSLINIIENTHEKQMTSGILSWVDDTIAFNGINAMMIGLNITDNYIIYLISYWIMLTVIYVVVDIIIFAFTYLTHFFNN